jgi:hypothetical protein
VAVDLTPVPGPVAPDEARAVAVATGILRQHVAKVHDPARHAQDAAGGRGRGNGFDHVDSSGIESFFMANLPTMFGDQ